MVRSLCLKVIKNRELALDASQSTWEIVYKHKDTFRNESNAGTWIYKIAYREALRTAQKERTLRYSDLIRDYHTTTIQNPIMKEDQNLDSTNTWLSTTCDMCLSGVIGTLNFTTRIIIVFKYILDISYEEISSILNMEQSAVRQAASRGKKRLRVFFEKECGLYEKRSRCCCGLAGQLETSSFKNEVLAMKTITDKARFLHEKGTPLPPMEYWVNLMDRCHKKATPAL